MSNKFKDINIKNTTNTTFSIISSNPDNIKMIQIILK